MTYQVWGKERGETQVVLLFAFTRREDAEEAVRMLQTSEEPATDLEIKEIDSPYDDPATDLLG